MTKARKIIFSIVLVIVLIPVVFAVVIQFPSVQTEIVRKVASVLSENLEGEVDVGSVFYSLPNTVLVKDVVMTDTGGDVTASVGKVLLNVSIPSLLTDHLIVHRVAVENSSMDVSKILKCLPKKDVCENENDEQSSVRGFESYSLDRLILKNIDIKAGSYSLEDRKQPFAMDYKGLDLSTLCLDASDIMFSDSLSLNINNLSFEEACGLKVDRFNGSIALNEEGLSILDFEYDDGDSHLAATRFNLLFSDFSDFSDFCQLVAFDADFLPSKLNFHSLRHYAGVDHIDLILNFDGQVKGPVADLRSDDFYVSSSTKRTSLGLKFRISGLPLFHETMAGLTVKNCETSMADIAQIVWEATGGKFNRSDIDKFAFGEKIFFTGSLDGLLSDFVAFGKVETENMGSINIDLLSSPDKLRGYMIEGWMNADDFNLGAFLSSPSFGKVSFDATATAVLDKKKQRNVILLDNLSVSDIVVKGKQYSDISVSGEFDSGDAIVSLISDDPGLSFRMDASLNSNSDGTSSVLVAIDSVTAIRDGRCIVPGPIDIEGFTSHIMTDLEVSSEIANLKFGSNVSFEKLMEMISEKELKGADARLSIDIMDFNRIGGLFSDDLYIGGGTSARLSISNDGNGTGSIESQLIAAGNKIFSGLETKLNLENGILNVNVGVDSLSIGNVVSYDSYLNVDFLPDEESIVYARINNSELDLDGSKWVLTASGLRYGEGRIALDGFSLVSGEHSFFAEGILSNEVSDRFGVEARNIDLKLLNTLLGMDDSVFAGNLNGTGSVSGVLSENKAIVVNVEADSCSVSGEMIGNLSIMSSWNDTESSLDLMAVNTLGDKQPVFVVGSYRPDDKNLSVDAHFDRMPLTIAGPFLSTVVSDFTGYMNGRIVLSGPVDNLSIKSYDCALDSLSCKLLYTQVPYTIDGPFAVDNDGIDLSRLIVSDKYGHFGEVSGGLAYDHFKNIRLDTHIKVEDILGLNTNASQGDGFYGRAFASGDIALVGGSEGLKLNMDITTGHNSTIHIPLSSIGKQQTSLLTFVGDGKNNTLSSFDSLRVRTSARNQASSSSAIEVGMKVNATPDVEVQLEINKTTGDVLKARGNGQINITAGGADSEFDIRGGYTISEGSYKFSMFGINARDFTLKDGGTISFNGDIMQSELDIDAIYKTKASIAPLIADTTSTGNRRAVECGLGVSGKLSNPEIAFNIEVPDVDPTTKGKVESALSTEDKRMKQFLAVLISGSFLPDEESSIVSNTSILYSNVSEIMASQINNIFRQLDIPLDLGFNYQPTQSGKDVFDVAISTQLFNNRVLINGNIGNRQYISSSQGEIVGDIDMEIKLSQGGQLRLNLFSHSADEYSNYLDQMQRNGAGIVYQEEFDTFRELLRKIFWSRKRREKESMIEK